MVNKRSRKRESNVARRADPTELEKAKISCFIIFMVVLALIIIAQIIELITLL